MDRVSGQETINIETEVERKRLRIRLEKVDGEWQVYRETADGTYVHKPHDGVRRTA